MKSLNNIEKTRRMNKHILYLKYILRHGVDCQRFSVLKKKRHAQQNGDTI